MRGRLARSSVRMAMSCCRASRVVLRSSRQASSLLARVTVLTIGTEMVYPPAIAMATAPPYTHKHKVKRHRETKTHKLTTYIEKQVN